MIRSRIVGGFVTAFAVAAFAAAIPGASVAAEYPTKPIIFVAPGTLGSQLDLALSAGEVVTVYLNELAQTGGGSGTVSIVALP